MCTPASPVDILQSEQNLQCLLFSLTYIFLSNGYHMRQHWAEALILETGSMDFTSNIMFPPEALQPLNTLIPSNHTTGQVINKETERI